MPSIFSVQEVECLIKVCDNLKHRTLLMVVYGAGLRISEALNLKVSDIDRDRQTLHIRNTKNRRERYVPLSAVLLQALTNYWQAYRFKDYVFPGSKRGKPLSQTSVAKVFKAAKHAAGIKKDGGVHSLRHSFAVHTLEAGSDLIAIKRLLGHRSIHSTVRYCEFSPNYDKRFQSPIDALKL
ncbi:MAG: tyrosine-type recombinase/integrase [Methyloprofundus sp.]|nr:tyrosine-type recombinase/integrase [Methyloprofundus sp.]